MGRVFTDGEVLYASDLNLMAQKDELIEESSFNMIDPSVVQYGIRYSVAQTKIIEDSTLAIAASGMIAVTEGEWYTVSGSGIYNGYQGGYFAEDAVCKAGQVAVASITFTTPVSGAGRCFQVPIGRGIKSVVISLSTNAEKNALAGDAQMETGEMATEYVPYELKTQFRSELLPSVTKSETQSDDFTKKYERYTSFGNLHYHGIDSKISKFKAHWLAKDKNLCVVNTGTSLTARSSEHCTTRGDAESRPPLMHSNNFATHIWDALKWEGQQYRRFDYDGFFTETGTFQSAANLSEWDDGPYRYGLTRYSDSNNAAVEFTVPSDAWQFNFIFRSDSAGSENCVVKVAQGNGYMVVLDEGKWVEANGHVFSQRESAAATLGSVTYTNPISQTSETLSSYQTKGNTTYQKRLYMKAVKRGVEKTLTVSSTSGRLLYWGCEWSPREFMITYINAARGSHSSAIGVSTTCLNHYQDNEVWGFSPDLVLTEDPIHNAGAGGKLNSSYSSKYFATVTDNFFFADNQVSMRSRCLSLGLAEPEWVIFNSTVSYNFGAFDKSTGELYYVELSDGIVWTTVDAQYSCYSYINDKYGDSSAINVVYINAIKGWYKAAIGLFGNLADATAAGGKDGTTFTNEGSHWNDTGSKVMARLVLPVLDFTT